MGLRQALKNLITILPCIDTTSMLKVILYENADWMSDWK